ncbi:MAG: hypothetical protein H6825_13540 [Planctomycetes bacterium]|nr:hypothetical protein [Planctomycetota bacterium]
MTSLRPFAPRLLGVACLAVLVLGLSVVARTETKAPTPDEQLHELMIGLKRQLKEFGRAVADPAMNETSLAAVAEMQAIALAAKTLEPSNLDEKPKEERAAHKAAYRADMARMLSDLCQMEIAILEGRNADAQATLQGPLFDLRESSHEKYQKEEGEEHHERRR